MKSNYNSPLELDHDGHRIRACGPLVWEGEQRVRILVTITQDGAIAFGATGEINGGDEWGYDARNGDQDTAFKPGPATAVGVVQVLEPEPARELPPWSQVVTLVKR